MFRGGVLFMWLCVAQEKKVTLIKYFFPDGDDGGGKPCGWSKWAQDAVCFSFLTEKNKNSHEPWAHRCFLSSSSTAEQLKLFIWTCGGPLPTVELHWYHPGLFHPEGKQMLANRVLRAVAETGWCVQMDLPGILGYCIESAAVHCWRKVLHVMHSFWFHEKGWGVSATHLVNPDMKRPAPTP